VSHGDGREGGRDSHGCMARAREGGRHGLLDLRHGVASCNATQRNATQHQAAGLDPACHGCPSPASAKTTNRCTRDLAHAQSRIDIRGLGVTIGIIVCCSQRLVRPDGPNGLVRAAASCAR